MIDLLDKISISIENTASGDKIYLNGEDVTTRIREKDVSEVVSPVSSIKEVRYKWWICKENGRRKKRNNGGKRYLHICFPNADVKYT